MKQYQAGSSLGLSGGCLRRWTWAQLTSLQACPRHEHGRGLKDPSKYVMPPRTRMRELLGRGSVHSSLIDCLHGEREVLFNMFNM